MPTCRKCSDTVDVTVNHGQCRNCYNAYMRDYMLARYHEWRKFVLDTLGGKCVDCGATENLELDHVERSEKSYNLAKIWSYKKEIWQKEIKKCVLRCDACHKAKTISELSVEHGQGLTGRRHCYCDLCKPLKRQYNKDRRTAKRNGTVS